MHGTSRSRDWHVSASTASKDKDSEPQDVFWTSSKLDAETVTARRYVQEGMAFALAGIIGTADDKQTV